MAALPLAFFVNLGLFLGGLALASVPIIIHLLNRRRVRRVEWAAMEWLRRAVKRHQRRLRIENWLILAMRCLAILLLGLALGRYVFTDSALAGLFGQRRSVYLVLDTSLSTDAKTDARSVAERVRRQAELVLESLGSEDAICVIATNDPDEDAASGLLPAVLQPRTIGSAGLARTKEAVARVGTRHAAARWSEALRLVEEQMQPEDVNRQVVVITDLQARDWLSPERATAGATGSVEGTSSEQLHEHLARLRRQDTRVQVVDVGGTDRRNLAISRIVDRTEHGAFVGRPMRLEVHVANHGDRPVEGAVLRVFVDDVPGPSLAVPPLAAADRGTRVPRPGRETVQVDLSRTTFEEPGAHVVRVEIGPPADDPGADALGLDSRRHFAVSVRRRIQVVAWARSSRDDAARATRLQPTEILRGMYEGDRPGHGPDISGHASRYEFRAVERERDLADLLEGRAEKPVDLVVLANVIPSSPGTLSVLRGFVREGGGLLVFVGDGADQSVAFNEAFHLADDEAPTTPDGAAPLCPFPLVRTELRDPREGQPPFRLDHAPDPAPRGLGRHFTEPDDAALWKALGPEIFGRVVLREPPGDGEEGPETAPDERIVLRYEDGAPAIVEGHVGEGRAVFVTTSLDYGWMARSGTLFAPVFLEKAALHLTRPKDAGRNLAVGDAIRVVLPPGAEEPRFTIPGGTQVPPSSRVDAAEGMRRATVTLDGAGVAGVWTLNCFRPRGTTREPWSERIAINPDADEGLLLAAASEDVQSLLPPELGLELLTGYGETTEEIEEVREGESTHAVLWILLGLLCLESFLAMRFGRRAGAPAAEAA